MPRINGIMQPLPNVYGTPGRPIESAKYNSQLDDLVADANSARPITAGGTGSVDPIEAREKLGVTAAIATAKEQAAVDAQTKVDALAKRRDNPNAVTAQQADALPIRGGVLTGRLELASGVGLTLSPIAGGEFSSLYDVVSAGAGVIFRLKDDRLRLMRGVASGSSAIVFEADWSAAAPLFKGQAVWHAGNFTPGDKADKTTSITAGNGLTGGGSLGADRAVALGTPGNLTATSANAVTATSHTHNVDWNGGAASITAGTIGSKAMCRNGSSSALAVNDTVSGSNLRYSSASGIVSGTPGGTWRCLGYAAANAAGADSVTEFIRIA